MTYKAYNKSLFLCLSGLFLCGIVGCKAEKESPAPENAAQDRQETVRKAEPEGKAAPVVSDISVPESDESQSPVAIVNGREIPRTAYDARIKFELSKSPGEMPEEFRQQFEQAVREKVLNEMILESILEQKVREKKIVISAQELKDRIYQQCRMQNISLQDLTDLLESRGQTPDQFKRQLRRELAFEKFMEQELSARVEVSEQEAKNFFQADPERFNTPARVRMELIYLRIAPSATEAEIKDIKAVAEELLGRLKNGQDFSRTAKIHSNAPSAENGGDTGYMDKPDLEPKLAEAAFTLPIGQLSDIIQTASGYYIIRVLDRKEPTPRTYDQVREEVIQLIEMKKKQQMARDYLQQLKKEADIQLLI